MRIWLDPTSQAVGDATLDIINKFIGYQINDQLLSRIEYELKLFAKKYISKPVKPVIHFNKFSGSIDVQWIPNETK